jgi:hypothetical protein
MNRRRPGGAPGTSRFSTTLRRNALYFSAAHPISLARHETQGLADPKRNKTAPLLDAMAAPDLPTFFPGPTEGRAVWHEMTTRARGPSSRARNPMATGNTRTSLEREPTS